MIFLVSFSSGSFWCSNVAIASSEEEVINHYGKKCPSVYISKGSEADIREAEAKGKPIVRL